MVRYGNGSFCTSKVVKFFNNQIMKFFIDLTNHIEFSYFRFGLIEFNFAYQPFLLFSLFEPNCRFRNKLTSLIVSKFNLVCYMFRIEKNWYNFFCSSHTHKPVVSEFFLPLNKFSKVFVSILLYQCIICFLNVNRSVSVGQIYLYSDDLRVLLFIQKNLSDFNMPFLL